MELRLFNDVFLFVNNSKREILRRLNNVLENRRLWQQMRSSTFSVSSLWFVFQSFKSKGMFYYRFYLIFSSKYIKFVILSILFSRDCPADLKEAISSVIYAAPRCSDLPELSRIRDIFEKKYGKDFVSAATDLRPESGVNRMVRSKATVFLLFSIN